MAESDEKLPASLPRTAREALIAELLGDAHELLNRSETLLGRSDQAAEALAAAVERLAGSLRQAGDRASQDVADSARRARADMDAESGKFLEAARGLSRDINATAATIRGESRRFMWRALALGAVGGLLATILVAGGVFLAVQ